MSKKLEFDKDIEVGCVPISTTSQLNFNDSAPGFDLSPENNIGMVEFDDKKLRRTNPKRYDPRSDWYTNINENLHDSPVENRYESTIEITSSRESKLESVLDSIDSEIDMAIKFESIVIPTETFITRASLKEELDVIKMNKARIVLSATPETAILSQLSTLPYPPSTEDLSSELSLDPSVIENALQQLQSRGVIYPVVTEDQSYWKISLHGKEYASRLLSGASKRLPKLPLKSYEAYKEAGQEVKFISDIFPKYYEYYKEQHSYYSNFFKQLERNKENVTGVASDVWKIFIGKTKNMEPFKGETSYSRPETLNTIEHAIDEVVQRFSRSKEDLAKAINKIEPYITGAKTLYQLFSKNQEKVLKIFKSFDAGSWLSEEKILDVLSNSFPEVKSVIEEAPITNVITAVTGILDNSNLSIFTSESKSILEKIGKYTGQDLVKVINKFTSTCSDTEISGKIMHRMFSGFDVSGQDLSGINLSNISIKGIIAQATIFNKSTWENTSVTDSNFSGAFFIGANCKFKEFRNNIIEGTDFNDAALPKNFLDLENKGKPRNVSIVEATLDKGKLPKILSDTPEGMFFGFPLDYEEKEDAVTVAKALGGVMVNLNKLSFKKIAVLEQAEINELNELLSSNTLPRLILKHNPNLTKWLAEKNKSKELDKSGFTPEQIKALFGKAGDINKGRAPGEKLQLGEEQHEKDPVTEKISEFISTYSDAEQIPKAAILDLIQNKGSKLYYHLNSFGDFLSHRELEQVYNNLITTLKQRYTNSYVKPVKSFKPFPFTTKVLPPKQSWAGNQLGEALQVAIILQFNPSMFPRNFRSMARELISETGQHFEGFDVTAHGRIAPFQYTKAVNNKTINRYVWIVTEMQSDVHQKMHKSDVDKKLDNKYGRGITSLFRSYIRDWAPNLLNSILQKAGDNNVDEVWVNRGENLMKNWNKSGFDWSVHYDEPAKMFGGELKNVGTEVPVDIGGGTGKVTSSEFYVIPIKKQKTSRLTFKKHTSLAFESVLHGNQLKSAFQSFFSGYVDKISESLPDLINLIPKEFLILSSYKYFKDQFGYTDASPEDMSEFHQAIRELINFDISGSPNIDWVYWIKYAETFVSAFVKEQKESTPGIASDAELSKDGFKMMEEGYLSNDVKNSDKYQKFKETIGYIVERKGLGNILEENTPLPQSPEEREDIIVNPGLDPGSGEPIGVGENAGWLQEGEEEEKKEEEEKQDLVPNIPHLDTRDVMNLKKKMIDEYLEKLHQAMQSGDAVKINEIKKRLKELTAEASKKLAFKVQPLEPRVGDKVRIIANREALNSIGMRNAIFGEIAEVSGIRPDGWWGVGSEYSGSLGIKSETWNYAIPLSHWNDFLEILSEEKLSFKKHISLKFGEQYGKEKANAETAQTVEQAPNKETSQVIEETELIYPTVEEILDLHDSIVSQYGGLLGSTPETALRLEAALGRMQSGSFDKEFYPSLLEKAAVLMHSIITAHPFTDGNKRTAFLSSIKFLHINGLTVPESEEIADIIVAVADDKAGYEHLLEWLHKNAVNLMEHHDEALMRLSFKTHPEEIEEHFE